MDNLNIYPIIGSWKTNKKGESSIYINIDLNGKRAALVSLKKRIKPELWDSTQRQVRKSHPNAGVLNLLITKEYNSIQAGMMELQLQGKRLTKETIKSHLAGNDTGSVLLFFKEFIQYHEKGRMANGEVVTKFSDNNIKKWWGEYNRLEAYTKGELYFSDINVKWLKDYEANCGLTLDKNTSLPVTMNRFLQILRAAESYGHFDMTTIAAYKMPTYRNPERPYLTIEQTEDIAEKVYDGSLDYDPALKLVACFFLVECWAGLRFSDWPRFTIERLIENDSIKVQAKKNNAPIYIPLSSSPRLAKIVQYIIDNGLEFNMVEQHTNRLLKVLSGICKIPFKMTTHVGRHTCATLLLELGYTYEAIAQWLGISVKTVEIYAKNTRRKLRNEYDKLGGL